MQQYHIVNILLTHITYCIIDHFKGRLLVIVIHSTVAVQDGHALLLSPFTVTPIHTVIRPVVPLAGEDVETLWGKKKNNTHITPLQIYYQHRSVRGILCLIKAIPQFTKNNLCGKTEQWQITFLSRPRSKQGLDSKRYLTNRRILFLHSTYCSANIH